MSSEIKVDTISENTSAGGVTIDGVLVKDNKVDINGTAGGIILDADADTTISANTDDQIDFNTAGNATHVFDANGHVTLKQFLDATTAGGRITGASNRGNNARVNLYQTAGSSDGGEIRLETANTGNSMTEAVRIHNNQVMSASAGIALGVGTANTSSNVLDDYEEGTWTPSGPSLGVATTHKAIYRKIGDIVVVYCDIEYNSSPADVAQATSLSGLPFSANDSYTQCNTKVASRNQVIEAEVSGSGVSFRDKADGVVMVRSEFAGNRAQHMFIYTIA